MLGFVITVLIGIVFLLGWIVGTIREAIAKQEDKRRLASIKSRIVDIDNKYPRALYLKYGIDKSYLTDYQLLKLVEVSQPEWEYQENKAIYSEEINFIRNWQERQKRFSEVSRAAVNKSWGCYFYDIDVSNRNTTLQKETFQFKIWHHFFQGYSIDYLFGIEEVVYDKYNLYSRYFTEQSIFLDRVEECTYSFNENVFDEIYALLCRLPQNLLILFADSGMGGKADKFNQYHFNYLMQKLKSKYPCLSFNEYVYYDGEYPLECPSNIVIIEAISDFNRFIDRCSLILRHKRNWEKTYYGNYENRVCPIPSYNSEEVPVITYISLMKEYSANEVKDLIKKKEEEYEIEKAKLAKAEEEKREKDLLEHQLLEEAEKKKIDYLEAKNRLQNAIAEWPYPTKSTIRCFSMFNYYPTDQKYNIYANAEDWKVRYLIWNFKAQPPTETPIETIMWRHRDALTTLSPIIADCLSKYFGNDTQFLTLVCVPSSKEIINKRRFEDFSETICNLLNMNNGFAYVTFISDGEASHFGGDVQAQYVVDKDYFKGKYHCCPVKVPEDYYKV